MHGPSRCGIGVRIAGRAGLSFAASLEAAADLYCQWRRGLHDATTELDVIKSWWMAHPTANIGLRTGVSFDVIDLDGEAAIDALEQARAGGDRLRGPVVKTGTGYHYLVLPTGVGNRARSLPGVDFRGQGGYIVAPPSIHPDGHRYQWINPLLEDLAPAPAWLLELLAPARTINSSHVRVTSTPSAYGRAALRGELERLSQATERTRNHSLNKAAFALGPVVAIGALDEQEVATTLICGRPITRAWRTGV